MQHLISRNPYDSLKVCVVLLLRQTVYITAYVHLQTVCMLRTFIMVDLIYVVEPCPQATPRFSLTAVEKKKRKKIGRGPRGHYYIMDQKWWTQLVRNVDSACTNRVHHFQSVT